MIDPNLSGLGRSLWKSITVAETVGIPRDTLRALLRGIADNSDETWERILSVTRAPEDPANEYATIFNGTLWKSGLTTIEHVRYGEQAGNTSLHLTIEFPEGQKVTAVLDFGDSVDITHKLNAWLRAEFSRGRAQDRVEREGA